MNRSGGGRTAARVAYVMAALLAGAAIAAGLVWVWLTFPRRPPLEEHWAATVGVLAGNIQLSDPFGVALAADGSLFVTEGAGVSRVTRISPDGRATPVAGGPAGLADGAGPSARFSTPSALALAEDGVIYVADTGNNAIRRITPDGYVSTVAGDGVPGYADGPAAQARFNGPIGVAMAGGGRIVVADTYNDRIRAISSDGTVATIAGGSGPGSLDGPAGQAQFHTPSGVAIDRDGRVLVADTGNGLIRRIDASGMVTTVASGISRPVGITTATTGAAKQAIYVTDERGRVVEIDSDGAVRAVAGSAPGFRDGHGDEARFRRPAGIAAEGPGRLVVVDAGNGVLRLVAATSQLELRPPASPFLNPHFDPRQFAIRPLLWPVSPMVGPHEIAGTMGEARGESADRFHSGIDVRVEEGTPVHAVREAVVTSPVSAGDFGSLNESIRIGDVAYVHVRVGRDRRNQPFDPERFTAEYDETGRISGVRVKRGARFKTGDTIATVNAFNHVHMNVGWPGEEHNPLTFHLVQFEDRITPTIPRNGVRLYDEAGEALTKRAPNKRTIVTGRVRIVVDAWDQADGNRPGRRLGLYALGYRVLAAGGLPAPGFEAARDSIRFDRAPTTPEAARIVFAPGSGIPFYGRRVTRFLYNVTSTFHMGVAADGAWDTALLPPGDYTVRAWAEDVRGNRASRDVPVTIVR